MSETKCELGKSMLRHYLNGYCIFNKTWLIIIEIVLMLLFFINIAFIIKLIILARQKMIKMTTYNPNILHAQTYC